MSWRLGQRLRRQFLRGRRFNHRFDHPRSRHDRHGEAVNRVADLLIGFCQRFVKLLAGFMKCLTDFMSGLAKRLLDIMAGIGKGPLGLMPGFRGSPLSITASSVGGPVPIISRPERLDAVLHPNVPGGREPGRHHHQENQK